MQIKRQLPATRPALLLILLVLLGSCGNSPEQPGDADHDLSTALSEAHRPAFHFTPPQAWMNDPNGMFYLDGEYHLHYQFYPDSTVWGPMHWGHAVSEDLVRWEHLPVSLEPDSLGYIFSGSAVVDQANTSGFGNGTDPPVVAAFTYHNPVALDAGRDDFQSQALAYSTDKGRTWTKYPGNPVIRNGTGIRDFRDPKIIWHEPTSRWIMSLAVYDRVQFYGSADLKDWEYLSEFGIEGDTRLWECPDLFPMRIPGSREAKWVLIVSIQQDGPSGGTGTSYFVGDFDGKAFTADPSDQKWLDYGPDNYAFVTWDNAPVGWGQRLGIGWMSNWQYAQQVPTGTWRSAMTVPRVLSLDVRNDDFVLQSVPVPSVSGLRSGEVRLPVTIGDTLAVEGAFSPSQCELKLLLDGQQSTAKVLGIRLSNPSGERIDIRYNREAGTLEADRRYSGPGGFSEAFFNGPHKAPLPFNGQDLDLNFLIDKSSMEIFADRGKLNFTSIFFPDMPYDRLQIWAEGGQWTLKEGSVFAMDSMRDPAR